MNRLLIAAGLMALSLPLLASPEEHYSFGHPAPAAQATRTVQVTLGDTYFEPKSLEVKAGETVRFVLTNKGQMAHEFNLGDAAMHARHQKEMQEMQEMQGMQPGGMDHAAMGHGMGHDEPNTVLVQPGKTAELTWTFAQADGIEFACNVPGHYQASMVGTLKIDK
ncbi:cupredoxin domain-containing protein [Pseudomonas akapageensis]|uniref:cupredoxin domain-containing protein n=1 Tax=Pseudomonas akapageensis TaxID=2609961 RepID=UPI0014089E79|nr:cupredoxin family protein [Pseudomonas akapageensis]